MRIDLALLCLAASLALGGCAAVAPRESDGAGAQALNMRRVGHDSLQARSAYQPTIQHQGARWIAYIGHHGDSKLNAVSGKVEDNGTSIVDVTDPAHPHYLAHIPGEPGKAEQGGAQMVRVCAGAQLPRADKGRDYILRTFGNQAQQIWDVTVPEHRRC